ncbi:hypothetical protein LO762_21155 [Actinocorallia sp. API 0066]|uniref:hypothetical protein n=1 Tax=Actinocorallia sp. API 0066 TaxID=2896846 RepID=UPI001E5807ED|nr:hypothetical protein [Actinocorallia sp. API 0066]MCD0451684.1 hypothetical protein [Actinocorallia sp. API 0066]
MLPIGLAPASRAGEDVRQAVLAVLGRFLLALAVVVYVGRGLLWLGVMEWVSGVVVEWAA